jgi:hypothetical protein
MNMLPSMLIAPTTMQITAIILPTTPQLKTIPANPNIINIIPPIVRNSPHKRNSFTLLDLNSICHTSFTRVVAPKLILSGKKDIMGKM